MSFLLILVALAILGVAGLSVVALNGRRAVPGASFFVGVGRDGLGTFDTVEDLGPLARFFRPEPKQAESAGGQAAGSEGLDSGAPAEPPLIVPITGNVEKTLSAHAFVEKHVADGSSRKLEGQ